VKIFWGYGLYPDRKGNFIDKTMAECTGAEMLEEFLKMQNLLHQQVLHLAYRLAHEA
jgi:oleate hydratase